jgi:hypothetical protein
MSKLQTYFDNLVTHLATAGDGLLTEITAKHVLFVTGDDPDLPKSVDEHVKRMVMQTKGLGLVIYADDGSNNNADAPDSDLDANITFEVRLFIHPQKWGSQYDPAKRKALAILEDLLIRLNGAEIEPRPLGCQHNTVVDTWGALADPEYWVWGIECHRALSIF